MDEMVDRLLDILADKLTERLSAGHKELYTAKELAERYGVSCATIRSKMAAGEFGELVSVGERTRLVPWAGVQHQINHRTPITLACDFQSKTDGNQAKDQGDELRFQNTARQNNSKNCTHTGAAGYTQNIRCGKRIGE